MFGATNFSIVACLAPKLRRAKKLGLNRCATQLVSIGSGFYV
jgi:hypothetical protein